MASSLKQLSFAAAIHRKERWLDHAGKISCVARENPSTLTKPTAVHDSRVRISRFQPSQAARQIRHNPVNKRKNGSVNRPAHQVVRLAPSQINAVQAIARRGERSRSLWK